MLLGIDLPDLMGSTRPALLLRGRLRAGRLQAGLREPALQRAHGRHRVLGIAFFELEPNHGRPPARVPSLEETGGAVDQGIGFGALRSTAVVAGLEAVRAFGRDAPAERAHGVIGEVEFTGEFGVGCSSLMALDDQSACGQRDSRWHSVGG